MTTSEKVVIHLALGMSGLALGGVIALSVWAKDITGLLAELTNLVKILVSLR